MDYGEDEGGWVGGGEVDEGRAWGRVREVEGEENGGGGWAAGIHMLQERCARIPVLAKLSEVVEDCERMVWKGNSYLCSSKM